MRGFTLIETIVAVAIFGLILAAVSAFIIFGFRTQSYTLEQGQAIQEARRAIDQMTKEVREATTGGDGSYLLERVDDYELVFYGDIDQDDQVERVRYFINPAGGASGQLTDTCVSFSDGGSCSVLFQNFLTGGLGLDSADIEVSVEGDLNGSSETADVDADGIHLGTLCTSGECTTQCSGAYEDPTTFDVIAQALDDSLQVVIDSSSSVNDFCDWQDPNHSIKAQVVFSWQETAIPQNQAVFRKGIIQPVGFPVTYPTNQEIVTVLSENVINEVLTTPIFSYYDQDNMLLGAADRLNDTTRIHFNLVVNVNPNRAPDNFSLESDVQLRNLKTNL